MNMSTHNEILKAKADGKFDLLPESCGPGNWNICFRRDVHGYFDKVVIVKWEDSFKNKSSFVPLYSFLDWTTKPSQRLIL
jgi:hypothetical protein